MEELQCNQVKDSTGTATYLGWDTRPNEDDKSAARHNAKIVVALKAKADAWDFANTFSCPEEGCPIKKVVIKIGQIEVKPPRKRAFAGAAAGPIKWSCEANCDWSVTVSCPRKAQFPEDDIDMEEQELDCRQHEEAFSCATNHAVGIASGITGLVAAGASALQKIVPQVDKDIDEAIKKVSCDPDCPKKTITIEKGPVKIVTDPTLPQPDANGDYTVELDQRWSVRIKCS